MPHLRWARIVAYRLSLVSILMTMTSGGSDPTVHAVFVRGRERCTFRIRRARNPQRWVFIIDRGGGSLVETGEVDLRKALNLLANIEEEGASLREEGWVESRRVS